jgi:ABC-type uncharacterized transport system substrate-binding protein
MAFVPSLSAHAATSRLFGSASGGTGVLAPGGPRLKRRAFVIGGAAALLAGPGRAAVRLHRIGFLRASPPPARLLDAFRQGLAEHGYIEHRDYVIVTSWADGSINRLPELAQSLARSKVDVIVTDGTRPAREARAAARTIPIVMAGGLDPVGAGLARSLSQPGGNVTGFTTQVIGLTGKTFEILKELNPNLRRIAVISPTGVGDSFRSAEARSARQLGISLVYIQIVGAHGVDAAMRNAIAEHAQAGVIRGTPFLSTEQRRRIVERSAANRLATMYETRDFVDLGGLISYGADFNELFRLAAGYVVRILAGADPGKLPIQQSAKIELVVNLKAAAALGLTIPQSILLRADAVIE